MAQKQKIRLSPSSLSAPVPDWSRLPPELLHLISEKLGDSFDAAIHARSVCNPWRSAFSYPSSVLSRITYSLPSFERFPRKSRDFCTLQNFPVYLFISRTTDSSHSEFFIGGIARDDHVELPSPSPVQCTVKVKMPWSAPTSINICDFKIVPLGRQYGMVGYDPDLLATKYRGAAFLPLTKKGGGEFAVLLGYEDLLVLTSVEMRWKWLEHGSTAACSDVVTFRGRFYALQLNGDLFVIDPYSLEVTPLLQPPLEFEDYGISSYLVPSGDDELYMVQKIIPRNNHISRFRCFACRVSRLDEGTGEWIVVTDLGDRVLLIGPPGNRTCLGKDLPDGCGVSGNSILFTDEAGGLTCPFKYGVDTRYLNYWRSTQQNRVTILSASPKPILMKSPVVSLRVERKP